MQNFVIIAEKVYTMNKNLITIVGPTAIGKTSWSIQLAQHFDCPIISADSRQFFKEMRIGTAVPTEEELAAAQHHFIQHKSILDPYSVGDFEKDALEQLKDLFSQNSYAILIGGSGLYIDAVINGLDEFPDIDPTIRVQLQKQMDLEGLESLQSKLKELDPVHFDRMDIQNPHRVMRALEVCIGTGTPYSSFRNQKNKERPFHPIKIGFKADREIIYDRINRRVDIMVAEGLIDEVKKLLPYQSLNALNTVGYKEIFKYLKGEWELNFAISEIKKNTRRFAKRQLTWFRKDPSIQWFDYKNSPEDVFDYIKEKSL